MSAPASWNFYGLGIDFPDEGGSTARVGSWYDREELTAASSLFRDGDRVLVAGGGLGSASLLLAAQLGIENVVTYEANPYLARLASNNISFGERRLDFRHAALSTHAGECDFHISAHWALSSTRQEMIAPGTVLGTLRVPSISVNEALSQDGLNALALDIEGGEIEILPSLNFDQLRVLVVELHGTEKQIAEARARIAREMTIEYELNKSRTLAVVGAVARTYPCADHF